MYCVRCGTKAKDGDYYCRKCGAVVDHEGLEEVTEFPPVPRTERRPTTPQVRVKLEIFFIISFFMSDSPLSMNTLYVIHQLVQCQACELLLPDFPQ